MADSKGKIDADAALEDPLPADGSGRGAHDSGVKRNLQARHLQMIALGGTIGTGLFLASGAVIQSAGPLGALIAYVIVGIMVFGVVTSLGEMCTLLPVSGAFGQISSRFVDDALGFTLGINYFLQWAITLPAELSAAGLIMGYWAPNVPSWVWAIVFLIPLVLVNLIGVGGYGETEYWLSFIKVAAIVIFILVGVAVDLGANKELGFIGGKNWNVPGAPIGSSSTYEGSAAGAQFVAILGAFTTAFYSYGGTEIVGVTSGESSNPRKNVPKAIKGTFWRIVLFYFLSILLLGLIIPVTDDTLGSSDITVAPFTRVYQYSGIQYADHIMNAVILVAVISAANSSIYCSSRTMMALSHEGKFPRIFGYVNSRGVPVPAILLTLGIGCLTFLGSIWGNGNVFNFLVNLLGLASLLSWLSINVTHLRFRWGWVYQGNKVSDLPYVAPFFPIPDILSLVIGLFVMAGLIYAAAIAPFDYIYDSSLYLGLPVFVFLYVAYAICGLLGLFGAKYRGFIKYEDMDFVTNRLVELPDYEQKEAEEVDNSFAGKLKRWAKKAVNVLA
ncbi:amino acid permease/ SLC12A domain-containing protein [Zopfochytrium polystomum]|nr:amino acid permease/ SLC12A domain-containing protein [Zopfochytrium polystomum]